MGKPLIINHLRNFEIDVLRGLAIVLMVIFHFSYDLTAFGWAEFNISEDIKWRSFRAVIVSGFLLAVGMSSYLAYSKSINVIKLTKTVGKLLVIAVLITLGSLLLHPTTWVYFGIIHFIAVALPISVLFVGIPNVALVVGLASIVGYWADHQLFNALWQWSVTHLNIPTETVDLVSFFPWIGVVLLGIFVMHKSIFHLKLKQNIMTDKLALLGQHSLLIYLIHQPILYFFFGLVDMYLGR